MNDAVKKLLDEAEPKTGKILYCQDAKIAGDIYRTMEDASESLEKMHKHLHAMSYGIRGGIDLKTLLLAVAGQMPKIELVQACPHCIRIAAICASNLALTLEGLANKIDQLIEEGHGRDRTE